MKLLPRPRKCRKVCELPQTREFHPAGGGPCAAAVIMTVDEYEAIRLIDQQGFSQEECSTYMQVARTTVQMIYNSARKKLAAVLVEGRPLRICQKKAGGGAGRGTSPADRGRRLSDLRWG